MISLRTTSGYARGTAAAILLLIMALMLPANLAAQSFVYVNNQDTVNTVSGFSVAPTGALTPIAGSPFATGGAGSTVTCYGLDRMTVNMADNLLFVSNSADQTISVFQIDPVAGGLTLAPGSPVNSGLALDGCGGISLASTPDGKFLMASSGGLIQSFNIAANGALTQGILTTPLTPVTTVGMKISSNGKLLALSGERSVFMYTVNADGSLTAVASSPFLRQSTGLISGLEFSCAADRLYGSEASTGANAIIDGWSVSAAGVLAPMAGSPFLTPGSDSNVVALSPDNTKLYTSSQGNNLVAALSIGATGSLTSIGTYGGPTTVHVPTGLAVDSTGSFLFMADDTYGIAVFGIAADGSLSPLSDVATIPGQEMQGVAAYPTHSCTTADLALTMTATPATVVSGSDVTITYSITNNGTAPAAATITDNLPAGLSPDTNLLGPTGLPILPCTADTGGVCSLGLANPHIISFPAIPAGATATATLIALTSTDLANATVLTNTATISNRSVIDANAVNDTVTATITISAVAGPTSLTIPVQTAPYGGPATISAVLAKTANTAGVIGKTVTFTFNGAAVGSATTDLTGTARLAVNVAGLAKGSYPITASFAGDPLFGASTGSGSLAVSNGVLTVSGSSTMIYGDPVASPLPYTITGFGNGDTSAVVTGTAACTSAVTSTSPVGAYPVTCVVTGMSAANYTITTVPGVITVAPAPITVIANNATRLYGDPNPVFTGTVTGTKNGDLAPVTYATSAQITSGVGSYVIVPLGTQNYTITSATDATLTITPAPLSFVANPATRTYGSATAPYTGTLTGLKNADPITPVYTTTATTTSALGVYPLTATLADPAFKLGNYTVTITGSTLTIVPAPLIVIPANVSRLYGSANPVLTGTLQGLVAGDAITATYTSTATITSPVGTYPITATLSDPGNKLGSYIVTILPGTLTVTPAPLTVAINNATRVYGNANPAFSGTISGLQNGDAITASYTSVGVTSPVGTFPITPVFSDPGAKLGNYTVTITGGNLVITRAPLAVTAVGGTRTYGAANPAITITGLKNGDAITATYTTPTTASAPGVYVLTPVLVDPNGLAGNYTVTTKSAALIITRAPLTIAATSATVVLNTTTPGFTANYTGFVLGQTPADLTGTLSCTAAVTTVGTHPITCSGQTSTNYIVTFTNGTATVDYAPVGTCTAGPGHQILAPIAADGSTSFTRATTPTIPIQFRVCDATGKAVSTNGVVTNFRLLQKITGGVTTTLNQGQNTGFAFSTAAQDWAITLNTTTPTNLAAGSTYVYQITLNDGTTINFQFSMK
ncbi:MAG TPA: MBG domain-containing protein [Candidatus Angelobacter sp.]|jgi:6-phosphogluconolactonase (cycloisomerase 2 family)